MGGRPYMISIGYRASRSSQAFVRRGCTDERIAESEKVRKRQEPGQEIYKTYGDEEVRLCGMEEDCLDGALDLLERGL